MCLESVKKLDHTYFIWNLSWKLINDLEKEINYKIKESANNWYFLLQLQVNQSALDQLELHEE